jgi:hypothetical protein
MVVVVMKVDYYNDDDGNGGSGAGVGKWCGDTEQTGCSNSACDLCLEDALFKSQLEHELSWLRV